MRDEVIYDHLAGKHTIGVYPLCTDNSCALLAVDFDDADWKADLAAFVRSCEDLDIPLRLRYRDPEVALTRIVVP